MYICIFSFDSYQAYMPNTYRGFLKHMCGYSPAGRSDPYWDLGETVPEVLSTASGGTQTEGTVSPNTDRPRR